MKLALVFFCCVAAALAASPTLDELKQSVESLDKTNKVLQNTIGTLGRQLMLQQFSVEERIRSDGNSGIKQVRGGSGGTKSYFSSSYVGRRICGIHDHSNNIRTVGMGEFIATMNGVEFRTRHNDYRLNMPHRTSKSYHKFEPVPFPDVPPAVLKKATVPEQITEMREWFRAWANSDHSKRDYRPYFQPVMCYLEGAWTMSGKSIDEPFFSDRHFVDASSWFDLQEKIRFTSYSGRKSSLENYSYLPTTIMTMRNGTLPVLAQWNYRIACHPVQGYVPLDRLRQIDDLAPRMAAKKTFAAQIKSRAARFQLNPMNSSNWDDRQYKYNFLDEIMGQIPGKDNYPGKLVDDAFQLQAFKYQAGRKAASNTDEPINAAYYHRWFKTNDKDAMGTSIQHRGFSDSSIFMAMNTQPKVASMTVKSCEKVKGQREKVCKEHTQRWSYAIPMELIFVTPLAKWNPYGLKYYDGKNAQRLATLGGRNGQLTEALAYKGVTSRLYYQTPLEFYSSTQAKGRDPADTARGAVGVLDPKGVIRKVTASGTHIVLKNIEGVGSLRTRYPIMPVHVAGNAVWKELEALKDMVMEQSRYLHLYSNLPVSVSEQQAAKAMNQTTADLTLEMTISTYEPHTHTLELSGSQLKQIQSGKDVYIWSSEMAGHSHNVLIQATKNLRGNKYWYRVSTCDGHKRCPDGHKKSLSIIE